MPAGSLLNRPRILSIPLQTVENALLPRTHEVCAFAASVPSLSPVELSAPDRLTSELLRFL
jgi:hypothetical protein